MKQKRIEFENKSLRNVDNFLQIDGEESICLEKGEDIIL